MTAAMTRQGENIKCMKEKAKADFNNFPFMKLPDVYNLQAEVTFYFENKHRAKVRLQFRPIQETMGMCLPCLGGSVEDYDQPDPETRRKQQAEAAEKRKQEIEGRGVKDPEGLKRKQQRREQIEKQAENQGGGEAGMRWQVG